MRRAQLAETPAPPAWRAPDDWRGATVAILATGPSLSDAQVEVVHQAHALGRCKTIVVKESYRRAPWADVCYGAADFDWKRIDGAPGFAGERISVCDIAARRYPGVKWLQHDTKAVGLSMDPTLLRTGGNSGFQALNLAVLRGATRVLLLGFDMRSRNDGQLHWFPNSQRPDQRRMPFDGWLLAFAAAVPDLERLGVEVLNCTPGSALQCFPKADIAAALQQGALCRP